MSVAWSSSRGWSVPAGLRFGTGVDSVWGQEPRAPRSRGGRAGQVRAPAASSPQASLPKL